jgi:hypothetical protein
MLGHPTPRPRHPDPNPAPEPEIGRDLDPTRHPDRDMGTVDQEFRAGDRSAAYLQAREEFLRGLDSGVEGGRARWFRDRAVALRDFNQTAVSVFEMGERLHGMAPDEPDRTELERAFREKIVEFGDRAEVAGRYPMPAEFAGDPDLVAASKVHEKPSALATTVDAASLLALKTPLTTLGRTARAAVGVAATAKGVLGAVDDAHATYEARLADYWREAGIDPSDPVAVADFATENADFTRKAMLAATIDTYVNLATDEGIGRIAGDTAKALRREFGLSEFVESIVEKGGATFLDAGRDVITRDPES